TRSEPVAPQPTERPRPEPSGRRVFVLGAGVDRAYGLPTMATLMGELAEFARGEGQPVNRALRDKLGRVQFSFDKHVGDQGNALITDLFSGSEELAPTLRSV